MYRDEETLDHQNVDDDSLLDRNQSIEIEQNTEEELVENFIESTTPKVSSITDLNRITYRSYLITKAGKQTTGINF